MEDFSIKKISFTQRPISIPAEYRPMYKIGLIVIILKLSCRAETSSLLKLHLLSWALMSENNQLLVRRYITSNYKMELAVWGIEPALNRALHFAIADNVCEIIGGNRYRLTQKGKLFYNLINSDFELFDKEKEFLKFVGKGNLPESRIQSMSLKRSDNYVEN